MSETIYKDIPGLVGYRAGSDGTIWSRRWSLRGTGERSLAEEWRQLKPRPNKFGYFYLTLTCEGRCRWFALHTLIVTTFKGSRPKGMQCCRHLDGNKSNNSASNLCWGTHKENRGDGLRLGEQVHGERCHSAKLNEGDVVAIRFLLSHGMARPPIAKIFGIDQSTVRGIEIGRTWKHIP